MKSRSKTKLGPTTLRNCDHQKVEGVDSQIDSKIQRGGKGASGFSPPLKTPTSDMAFMRLKRIVLAHVAWEGYKACGRGIICVLSPDSPNLEDLKNTYFHFLPALAISKHFIGPGATALATRASEYNPETQFVISFGAHEPNKSRYYTIESIPPPPYAKDFQLRRIAAALDRCVKISKNIGVLQSRFNKVGKKSGVIDAMAIRDFAISRAISGMNELAGRAQGTAISYAKPDGTLMTRTLKVLHRGYNMHRGPSLWNLFNKHLRPLNDPQPQLDTPAARAEALIEAAAIAWAFKQSHKVWQTAKRKEVHSDYLQAYEMVRRIVGVAFLDASEAAVEALASIGQLVGEQLERLPKKIVRSVARRHPSWPVLLSARATDRSKQSVYLEGLEIGADCPLNSASSSKRDETLATTQHAVKLLAIVEYNRALGPGIAGAIECQMVNSAEMRTHETMPDWVIRATKLPPFSNVSAPQWWEVAKAALKEACPKVEEHSGFNVAGAVVAGDQNDPAIRRARIIERIRAAFVALAPN